MVDRRQLRREHVAAGAIYGTIVYLTILVLLEEDRTDPQDALAILIGTALVFWLAHVYAHLVLRIAVDGRFRADRLLETANDQVGDPRRGRPPVGTSRPRDTRRAGRSGWAAWCDRGRRPLARRVRRPRGSGGRPRLGTIPGIAAALLVAGLGLLWLEVSLH
jgi:hypothetical protein